MDAARTVPDEGMRLCGAQVAGGVAQTDSLLGCAGDASPRQVRASGVALGSLISFGVLVALLYPNERPDLTKMRRETFQLVEILNPDGRIVFVGAETSAEFAFPLVLLLGRHPVGEGWWAPRVVGEFLVDSGSGSKGAFAGAGAVLSRKDGLAGSLDLGWQTFGGRHLGVVGGGPGWSWPDLGQLRLLYRVGAGGGPLRHVLGVDFELFFDLVD